MTDRDGGRLAEQFLDRNRPDEAPCAEVNVTLQRLAPLLQKGLMLGPQLDLALADELPAAGVDPSTLEQVLIKLVSLARACTHTPIRVSTFDLALTTAQSLAGEVLPPGRYVCISVTSPERADIASALTGLRRVVHAAAGWAWASGRPHLELTACFAARLPEKDDSGDLTEQPTVA